MQVVSNYIYLIIITFSDNDESNMHALRQQAGFGNCGRFLF